MEEAVFRLRMLNFEMESTEQLEDMVAAEAGVEWRTWVQLEV